MKRIWVIWGMIVIQWVSLFGFNHLAFGKTSWGVRVYPMVREMDVKHVTIAGVNLAEYGYVRVYQYIQINNDTLFVLGEKKLHTPVLSEISLHDHKECVVVQYSEGFTGFLSRATCIVFYLEHLDVSKPFILLEYLDGNISRTTQETTTYLEIFHANPPDNYTLVQREQLTETHVVYEGLQNIPNLQYRYVELVDNGTDQQPATHDLFTYFFSDANADGYADILLWRRHYVSRAIDDLERGDFYVGSETMEVMYFDPAKETFSRVVSLDQERFKHLDEIFIH